MTTYNTRNPLGSPAPKDLFDNAQNLDHRENDRERETWPDRFGVQRLTWLGIERNAERQRSQIEQRFAHFLASSGYQDIGDYAPGLEITERNQIFWRDGELYRAGAGLSLPYIATGVWEDEGGQFVAVGDAALRQELGNPISEIHGTGMLAHSGEALYEASQLGAWLNSLSAVVTGFPWLAPRNGLDAAPAINAAITFVSQHGGGRVVVPGVFTINSQIIMKTGVFLDLSAATLIQGPAANLENLILCSGVSKFKIIGGKVDVNFQGQSYSGNREDVGRGVLAYNCTDFSIIGTEFVNPFGSSVLCALSRKFKIIDIESKDTLANAASPIKINSCNIGWIERCYLYGREMSTGYGIEILAPSSDIHVYKNDVTFYQIVALNETSQDPQRLARINISNNSIKTPTADNSIHWSVDSVFSGNIIQDSGDVGMSHDYSVRLSCTGNVVNGANASTLAAPGALNCTFTGNVLRNPGRQNRRPVTPGQRCGIWLPSSHDGAPPHIYPDGNTIAGNTIIDQAGGMYFGISVALSPDSSNRNNIEPDTNYIDGPLPIDRLIDFGNSVIPATQWQNLTLQNGWVNVGDGYSSLGFFKGGNGVIQLRGVLSGGAVNQIIAILPPGYRPGYKTLINVITNSGAGELVVNGDGAIVLQKGGVEFVSFDSCQIRA